MASEPQLGDGGVLGGHEILYQLRAGGMGEVLLARKRGPSGFERLVALKTIRAELRGLGGLRQMFLDEAQLMARLNHPAIAQIYDFGEDGGVFYLAMEYVAGVSLREVIALSPPPAVCAAIMVEVCRALHSAHELRDLDGNPLGVVHRDVSPDNVMLTFDAQIKVLDFGIAVMRGRSAPVTEYGMIKGKPPYLSPEQVKAQPIDRRTDVFAASSVLHELLTGKQLFDGDSVYAIAHAILHQEVAPPSATVGPLPAGLDAAVMRGLERDPRERWQSADELGRALGQVVDGEGGESLADYAARALGEEHSRHRAWLRKVIERGGQDSRPAGRPSGIVTVPAPGFDANAPTLDATLPHALRRRGLMGLVGVGALRRRGVMGLVGAAVLAGAITALWLARGSDADRPARAIAEAPAPVVTALEAAAPAREAVVPAREATAPAAGEVDEASSEPGALSGTQEKTSSPEPPALAETSSDPGAADRAAQKRPRPRKPRSPARSVADSRAAGAEPRGGAGPGEPRGGAGPGEPRGGAGSGETRGGAMAAEPAPEPEGSGTIILRTQAGTAWAKVRIDGSDAGVTPIKREIAAGSHEIEFVRPDNDKVRLRRRVHVLPGREVEVVAP
jgi:eukaryotic-like serine/threonine-protein kinase